MFNFATKAYYKHSCFLSIVSLPMLVAEFEYELRIVSQVL
jgi:hypothetical protein